MLCPSMSAAALRFRRDACNLENCQGSPLGGVFWDHRTPRKSEGGPLKGVCFPGEPTRLRASYLFLGRLPVIPQLPSGKGDHPTFALCFQPPPAMPPPPFPRGPDLWWFPFSSQLGDAPTLYAVALHRAIHRAQTAGEPPKSMFSGGSPGTPPPMKNSPAPGRSLPPEDPQAPP